MATFLEILITFIEYIDNRIVLSVYLISNGKSMPLSDYSIYLPCVSFLKKNVLRYSVISLDFQQSKELCAELFLSITFSKAYITYSLHLKEINLKLNPQMVLTGSLHK